MLQLRCRARTCGGELLSEKLEVARRWRPKGSPPSEPVEGGPERGTSPPLISLLIPRSRKRPRPPMNELLCECFTDSLNICAAVTKV